ncbi:MAG: dual specificity protein phosphatase family protein [Haloferacaceae archaeon]
MDRVAPSLLIGTVEDATDSGALRRYGVDAVVRVAAPPATPYPPFVRVRATPLVDGPDNAYADFRDAADGLRALLDEGHTTLVHCTAGRSRSAAVAAAVLAVRSDTAVQTAIDRIDATRSVDPHDALIEQAERYVRERGRRD